MGDNRISMEQILIQLEEKLHAGQWKDVDTFLINTDVVDLTPASILAALSITFTAKPVLLAREDFFRRAEVHLRSILGHTRADVLLKTRR
jgi:hypothetical protein